MCFGMGASRGVTECCGPWTQKYTMINEREVKASKHKYANQKLIILSQGWSKLTLTWLGTTWTRAARRLSSSWLLCIVQKSWISVFSNTGCGFPCRCTTNVSNISSLVVAHLLWLLDCDSPMGWHWPHSTRHAPPPVVLFEQPPQLDLISPRFEHPPPRQLVMAGHTPSRMT